MVRKLRIKYEGAIYHVTFRGNARQAIFVDDRDRERLTERVGGSAQNFGVNPVVTRRWVKRPIAERREALRAYEWSSYRRYIGLALVPPWLIRECPLPSRTRHG